MQDLRLIGVDDDGGHLLLASVDGARFRVPLDESLRAAARRDRPRLGQLQIEIEGGMRPRDVQAMVRAGMSADEVAERSGWTVEKVHKYEGPILAEREYVAGLGRAVRLRQRGGSGPSTTLGQRVADRLTARGVEADSIEWDAWRREGPEWTVAVNFSAGGRVRQGTWAFDVASRSLHAKDDEARWLSEDEPAATPVPREAPVYDVEADGGLDAAGRRSRADDPVDLVTAMRERSAARSRRGSRRRGLEPVAALPLGDAVQSPPDDHVDT
ncbi:MAG TPA: septation protein SepH, partial [Dermatophilaceae bacterium]|nr:septation protein SepH [Dermatophilaceae bacterium]